LKKAIIFSLGFTKTSPLLTSTIWSAMTGRHQIRIAFEMRAALRLVRGAQFGGRLLSGGAGRLCGSCPGEEEKRPIPVVIDGSSDAGVPWWRHSGRL
jgi:hypothetical protein